MFPRTRIRWGLLAVYDRSLFLRSASSFKASIHCSISNYNPATLLTTEGQGSCSSVAAAVPTARNGKFNSYDGKYSALNLTSSGCCFKNISHASNHLVVSLRRNFSSQQQKITKPMGTEKPTRISPVADIVAQDRSLFSSGKRKKVTIGDDWQIVYRFKYIKAVRGIQRLKVYQTALTCCVLLPGSFGFYMTDAVPLEYVSFMLGVSALACGMLFIMGQFCSQVVGIMYVSKSDPSIVRVAHMNFWGMREDQIFKKTDFVPVSELRDNSQDVYVNVKFYSDPDLQLRISFRYGQVYNQAEFAEIFGADSGIHLKQLQVHEKREKNDG